MENRNSLRFLAHLISGVLHPFLIPFYMLHLVFHTHSLFAQIPQATKLYCFLVTFVSLLLVPLLCIPILFHFRLVRSFSLSDKMERVWMLLVTIASAFFGFWLLRGVAYTEIVQRLYLILILLLSGCSIISLKWRISLYLTGMGVICGLLLVLGLRCLGQVREWLMIAFLLTGLLASCRIYLNKDLSWQVYFGFLYGFLIFTFIL